MYLGGCFGDLRVRRSERLVNLYSILNTETLPERPLIVVSAVSTLLLVNLLCLAAIIVLYLRDKNGHSKAIVALACVSALTALTSSGIVLFS
ncbi:hypothetical protein J2S53_004077 [Actinopolyspora lacussalsi]|nr:hypothetical protein [Actinopolyspora lacussalsi]